MEKQILVISNESSYVGTVDGVSMSPRRSGDTEIFGIVGTEVFLMRRYEDPAFAKAVFDRIAHTIFNPTINPVYLDFRDPPQNQPPVENKEAGPK